MDDRSSAFAAFSGWLDRIDAEGLPAVLLRPKAVDLASSFEGDYDYLVDPDVFAELFAVALDVCIATGAAARIIQTAPHKRVIRFLAAPDTADSITVELWPHVELALSGGRLGAIDWAQFAPTWRVHGGIPDTVLGLVYATHIHHKKKDLGSTEVGNRLDLLCASLRGSSGGSTLRILEQLRTGRLSVKQAERAARSELSRLGMRPRWLPLTQIRRSTRRLSRRLTGARSPVPTRVQTVALLGPDGSGKTTLATTVIARQAEPGRHVSYFIFKHLFRKLLPFRALYKVTPWWSRARGRQPPKRHELKNRFDERHPHLLMAVALLRWPVVRARLARAAKANGDDGILLVDRYFWDYLIRPRDIRYRAQQIPGMHLYRSLVPKPDLVVILACPTHIVRERKEDLSEESIEAVYWFYCQQIAHANQGDVLLLPTHVPIEGSSAHLARFLGVSVSA